MNDRMVSLGVLLTVGWGGMLFAPVFSPSALLLPLGAVLLAVAAADEVGRRIGRWRRVVRPALGALLGVLATIEITSFATTLRGLPTPASWERVAWLASQGWRQALRSTWPADPELAGFVCLLCLAAAVAALELLRDNKPAAALVPGLAVALLAQGFGQTAAGTMAFAAAAYCVLAIAVLSGARRPDLFELGSPGRAGAGRLVRAGATLVVVVAAAGLGWLADPFDRAPVSLRDVVRSDQLPFGAVNPLDQIGDRLRDPQRVVFQFSATAVPSRWPVVVLEDFDGRRWSAEPRYQRLGTIIAPGDAAPDTEPDRAHIVLVQPIGPWLPTQPGLVSVSGVDPLVDPGTGMVLVPELGSMGAGLRYQLAWRQRPLVNVDGVADRMLDGGPLARTPADFPAEFTEVLVAAIGQEPPTVSTALKLEKHLRDNYRVAVGKQLPTGHGYAQLYHFLTVSKRGTSEQFATAYVLLARAAGIPARLVVGFRTAQACGQGRLCNGDVLAWPEILLPGGAWLALDPTAGAKTSTEGSGVAEAADQPLLPPRQTAKPDPESTPEPTTVAPTSPPVDNGGPAPLPLAATLLAVLVLAYPMTVLIAKATRAHRRRRGAEEDVVAGAWHEARDRLRDHGLTGVHAMTPAELARRAPVDESTRLRLHELSHLVAIALWSGNRPTAGAGAAAWASVRSLRSCLARRGLLGRIRAALSWRSLRALR